MALDIICFCGAGLLKLEFVVVPVPIVASHRLHSPVFRAPAAAPETQMQRCRRRDYVQHLPPDVLQESSSTIYICVLLHTGDSLGVVVADVEQYKQ
jgi:hypothetical protein